MYPPVKQFETRLRELQESRFPVRHVDDDCSGRDDEKPAEA